MKKIILLLLFILSKVAFSQNNDLDFLVQKIKIDYPGYAEKTKGIDFDKFIAKTVSENKSDTFKIMAKIVDFFHDRHLDLFRVRDTINVLECARNLEKNYQYLRSTKSKKKYEGFWLNESKNCVIAIVQVSRNPLRYIGSVVECRERSQLVPGMEFYDFEYSSINSFFTKAIGRGGSSNFYVYSEFRNDSIMTSGPYNKWHKLPDYKTPLLSTIVKRPTYTTGYWLDSNNYVLTIPSSTFRNGQIADSLIKANPAIRTKLRNLIVDIRNNSGGTVSAYDPILPLIYTNPILMVNGSIFCTVDDLERTKKDLDDYLKGDDVDSFYINDYKKWIILKEQNLGKFIATPQDTLTFDSISTYPQRVAYIINYGCQSAAEIALLDAKQSKKVTLFGEHTMGAIDYLNYYPHTFPSGKYELFIATTRRTIPRGEKKLDRIGIYPDVRIDDSEKDWVEYIKRYYEKH
jgi:hypothetical protein